VYIWVVLTSCFACILICWLSLFYKSPTLSQETLYTFLSFISRGWNTIHYIWIETWEPREPKI
jgi:hypothetical protein